MSTGLGIVTVGDVAPTIRALDGQIEGLNTAVSSCTAMSASDKAAWTGFYNGWKQGPLATWNFYQTYVPAGDTGAGSWFTDPAIVIGEILELPSLYASVRGFQQQAGAWQSRVKQTCPGYSPPPSIPTPQPLPKSNFFDQFDGLTTPIKALGGVIVAGLAGWAAFEVFEFAAPMIAGARAAARAKKETPRLRRGGA